MTTEEEEIDILGDFDVLSAKQEREISNISSGQILSCDYTVHPRWLDNADSTDIWIDNHAGNDCRQIFNSTELENCDEVTANENKLIFEKDIPALNEEEVITNSSEKDIICDLIEYNDELKIYCKPNSRSMQNNQVIISKINKFEGSQMFAKNISHRNKSKNNPISNRSNTKTGRLLKKLLKSNRIRKESKVKSPYVQKLSRNKNSHRKLRENNITITHEMDNNILSKFERSPLPPALIPFGEIVKVINDVDSDLEVDIEDASEAISIPAPSIIFENHNPTFNSNTVKVKAKPLRKTFKRIDADVLEKLKFDNVKIYEKLITMDVPEQELVIQNTEILEVEQFVHAEFFEGRPTKTRERYLKIRNHILNSWNKSKPNYLSKTAVRLGLKNCGDVHCISRIHSLLEQIGAINFNKSAYFQYIRPLTILIDSFNNQLRNKPAAIDSIERRPRVRLNSMNIPGKDSNTNITIEHVNGVAVPIAHVTIASNNETHEKVVQNEFELVKCLQFSQDNSTPIKITISISTLLCLYLHALSSNQEVMGFLGGHHERCTNGVNIQLTRYKPCRTSSQSRTMCEMCPVSQVEQTSKLLSEGYKLLGWVHTHPSFLPNPSRTDVKSQVEMQMQFSCNDIPFIAFILSCLDMSFKCFYVQAKDLNSSIENGLPYELNVEIEKDYSELRTELNDVVDMIDKTNPKNVSQIFNNFCDRSTSLFEQYSIDFNIAELIQSFELLK